MQLLLHRFTDLYLGKKKKKIRKEKKKKIKMFEIKLEYGMKS